MSALTSVAVVAMGVVGTVVVLVRDPFRQVLVTSVFGVVTAVVMLLLGAPDVALSEIVVGGVVVPVVVLLALSRLGEMDP